VSGSGSTTIGSLPADFFSVTVEDVKREQKERAEVVDRESMLRTKVCHNFIQKERADVVERESMR
jgi:hypothetical protein